MQIAASPFHFLQIRLTHISWVWLWSHQIVSWGHTCSILMIVSSYKDALRPVQVARHQWAPACIDYKCLWCSTMELLKHRRHRCVELYRWGVHLLIIWGFSHPCLRPGISMYWLKVKWACLTWYLVKLAVLGSACPQHLSGYSLEV